jgi:hypothetical protein
VRSYSNLEAFRFYKDAIAILKQKLETEQNKKERLEVILLMAVPIRILAYPEEVMSIVLCQQKKWGSCSLFKILVSKD